MLKHPQPAADRRFVAPQADRREDPACSQHCQILGIERPSAPMPDNFFHDRSTGAFPAGVSRTRRSPWPRYRNASTITVKAAEGWSRKTLRVACAGPEHAKRSENPANSATAGRIFAMMLARNTDPCRPRCTPNPAQPKAEPVSPNVHRQSPAPKDARRVAPAGQWDSGEVQDHEY
ncbi:hypothetical protein [Ancylobacter mangrovi]|uniref:hypothetical protein n=1 Tax=Ancylobacter mangrovi TaxID=2972472 RepID=UPI002162A745|nr:hypothetical protein [Ancylobacter mangrovi]MCS0503324.1 hypothetical protein [Ancylobacter mangrovi]